MSLIGVSVFYIIAIISINKMAKSKLQTGSLILLRSGRINFELSVNSDSVHESLAQKRYELKFSNSSGGISPVKVTSNPELFQNFLVVTISCSNRALILSPSVNSTFSQGAEEEKSRENKGGTIAATFKLLMLHISSFGHGHSSSCCLKVLRSEFLRSEFLQSEFLKLLLLILVTAP